MQLTRKHLLAAAIVSILAVFFAVRYLAVCEETEVRRRLRQLAGNLSRRQADSGLRLSLKNQRLAALLADPCRFVVPTYEIDVAMRPRQAAAEVFRLHSQISQVSVRFYDVRVDFPEPRRAAVRTTAYVRARNGTERRAGAFADEFELSIDMVLDQRDGWLFARFEQVEVLQR